MDVTGVRSGFKNIVNIQKMKGCMESFMIMRVDTSKE